MALNSYRLKGFRGGIADDAYKGVAGAFRFGYGLDIRNGGDTLKCNQALKKDSGDVVTDLILFFVPATNGKLYGFGDSGNIYSKDTPTSAWVLKYADPDGKITGAHEYTNNDGSDNYVAYLYWATETKLKRIKLTDSFPDDVEVFQTLNGDPAWHTMLMACGVLQICDGRYIAIVDYEGNFNLTALDLIAGNRTKCLLPEDQTVVIGSHKGDKVEEGWLWTWDKVEPSWIMRRMIAEKGINAIIHTEFILIQAGISGSLYFWDTANLLRIKQLPGGGWVNPGAVANYKGMPLLGVTGSDKCGVYSYGRLSKNESYALNLEWIPSHGKLEDVEIGAVVMLWRSALCVLAGRSILRSRHCRRGQQSRSKIRRAGFRCGRTRDRERIQAHKASDQASARGLQHRSFLQSERRRRLASGSDGRRGGAF